MNFIWTIAIKKAGLAIVTLIVALLSSPKVVDGIAWLADKGFHVNITVDQTVAAVSMVGLLTALRNYLKVKMKASYL